jgi:UPF0716 protein FxsA
MPFFLALIVLLSLPALEIYVLVQIYHVIGGWVFLLLLASAFVGWSMIAAERVTFFARITLAMQSGRSPFGVLISSGRTMLAGALLIIPGVITDVVALLVLLVPARLFARKGSTPPPTEPGVIEGEYRREHDDRLGR